MNSFLKELSDVREHCARPDWDGYNARSISLPSFEMAERFARTHTGRCKTPSVGVDALTGFVSFRWGSIRRNYLSLTFSTDDLNSVTCLVGDNGVFSERRVLIDSAEFNQLMEGCR